MPPRAPLASVLVCLALAWTAAGSPAQEPPPLVTEDVRYPSGDLTLAALYLRPEDDGRVPAAVIVQGSGSSGRENVWSRWVAVARAGYGVLLTDKRGVGAPRKGTGARWASRPGPTTPWRVCATWRPGTTWPDRRSGWWA